MTTAKITAPRDPEAARPRTGGTALDRALRTADRLASQGENARAVRVLQRAIDSGADFFVCTLRIAAAYREMQRRHEALAAVEQATVHSPLDRAGWELMLDIAEEAGDRRRAVMAGRALIKISPRHIRAHTVLSEAYLKDGDIPAALKIADILIRLDPASAAYHYNRALLCQHQSEIEQAVCGFIHTIWLEPDGPFSDSARCFLQDLDILQLSQIVTLASEDTVFRTRLLRNCREAAIARGFALSPMGEQLLEDYCEHDLIDSPPPRRVSRYH